MIKMCKILNKKEKLNYFLNFYLFSSSVIFISPFVYYKVKTQENKK